MFEVFKEKSIIKQESFDAGYARGKSISEKFWRNKFKEFQKKAKGIIADKNKEIESRNIRVLKIEKELYKFLETVKEINAFIDLRGMDEYSRHMQMVSQYREVQMRVNEMNALARRTEKNSKNIIKEIELYKSETL